MDAPTASPEDLSPSTRTALRWGGALAAHRAGVAPGAPPAAVEPADLLVGVVLAHPDAEGEGRVLLGHFGLTARDVLPPGYPEVTVDDLRRRSGEIGVSDPPLTADAATVLGEAQALARSTVHLRHLLGAFLVPASPLRNSMMTGLAGVGESLDAVEASYRQWLESEDSSRGRRAGASLRAWLEEHNPRRPVDVPAYCADRVDASADLIGIGAEADAFAYLVASRALRPPLAVGLFGDWGSGKSFLMRGVKDRVGVLSEMVADSPQGEAPVWKNIKQIEFNAWEYVEGDLWAGLLERIFRDLGTVHIEETLVAKRRLPVDHQIKAEEKRAEEAAAAAECLTGQRGERERALERAEQDAKRMRGEAEQERQRLLEEMAQRQVRGALENLWTRNRLALVGKDVNDLLDALDEARTEITRGSTLASPYWRRWQPLIAISLGAFLVPLVAYVLYGLERPPLVAALGGLATVVPVAAAALRQATAWTRDRLDAIESAERQVRQQVDEAVSPVQDAAQQAEQRLLEARGALEALDAEVAVRQAEAASALARAEELRSELRAITPARVFLEFADERSDDYRRRLGLLSRVREDLSRLEEHVREQNQREIDGGEHGGDSVPNRIVLYVDDLDRCPPKKVLQVLEAVHLLLAFEMFVVVVAVDTRWLSSALTERLHVLRAATPAVDVPTPRDYLEKIFQLPFWVQPLADSGRRQLVRGLLAPSVRGPGGEPTAEVGSGLRVGNRERQALEAMLGSRGRGLRLESTQLALSVDDLRFLESLAPLLGDTPRQVKRFVNTCQFLLAMRPPLATAGTPSERHVACLLAAVAQGLPQVADLLAAAVGTPVTLRQLLHGPEDDSPRARLRAWVAGREDWEALPASRLAARIDVVRRLQFTQPGRLPARPLAPGEFIPQAREAPTGPVDTVAPA